MQPNRQSILNDALKLPDADRAVLVDELIASLDADAPLSQEWEDVIALRLREIDEGKVAMVAGDEVMRKLRAITHGRTG